MGRKNSFKPESFIKTKVYEKLECSNKISWYEDRENLEEFINYLIDNYPLEKLTESNDLDDYKSYLLIGKCEINTHLKYESLGYMYFITDPDYKDIYISIDKSYPLFWYKYTTKKDFYNSLDNIYKAYNPTEYKLDFESDHRGFIGTEKMLGLSIDEIENHFILNIFTELLPWGSVWKDHPFRDIYQDGEVSSRQNIIMQTQAMKQLNDTIYHVNIRTQYSKSIITVEDYDGAFIINIQYDPVPGNQIHKINEEIGREYKSDLPVDVCMAIIGFPFVTHLGLLKLSPLTNYNFMMASLVANKKEMYDELVPVVESIKEEHEDNSIVTVAEKFLSEIKTNKRLEDIFSDKNIENFIDEKMTNLQNGNQSFEQVQDDILKEIDKKLVKLNFNDKSFKDYLSGIVHGILINNL